MQGKERNFTGGHGFGTLEEREKKREQKRGEVRRRKPAKSVWGEKKKKRNTPSEGVKLPRVPRGWCSGWERGEMGGDEYLV